MPDILNIPTFNTDVEPQTSAESDCSPTLDPASDDTNSTILDISTDLNDTSETSTTIEDVPVPFLGDVDFAIAIEYSSETNESQFVSETAIANSINRYLDHELNSADASELMIDDFSQFLVADSDLGIGSLADSVTVELLVEPNSFIPEPITAISTVFID